MYYDHATMMALRLGQWAGPGGDTLEWRQERNRIECAMRRGGTLRRLVGGCAAALPSKSNAAASCDGNASE